MAQTVHIQSIDTAKGGLIFLVVVGHLLLGELDDNFARYFIYSFHMPMFIFISGYLIKRDKLQSRSPIAFLVYYAKRMLGWWFLAWCVYTGLSIAKDGNWGKALEYLLEPYYHLWYVPTLLCMTTVVYLLQKLCRERNILFWLLLFSFSLACKCTSWPSVANMGWMLYFSVGVACGNIVFRNVKFGGRYCWTLYILAILAVYKAPRESLYPLWAMPLTLALILLWLYPNLKEDALPRSPLLAYWGRQSLHIYLWHVFPIALMKNLFEDSFVTYYIGSASLIGGFIFVSKFIIKNNKQ